MIPLHFQPSQETVRDYAEDAVRLTMQNYQLDLSRYQPEGLDHVDKILDAWKAGGATVNQVGKSMYTFGAYAGEVLRNLEPGKWFKPDDAENADDFGDYPFLAVRLFDGRVWRPVNLAFQIMMGDGPSCFRRSLDALLTTRV